MQGGWRRNDPKVVYSQLREICRWVKDVGRSQSIRSSEEVFERRWSEGMQEGEIVTRTER